MRITISVGGKFHAFYLAKQLQHRGCLKRLITSYPIFEAAKYGVERNKIKSLLVHELMNRAWRKAPEKVKSHYNLQYLLSESFDFHASRNIPEDTDLFVGWSSFSLHSLRRAKQLGAKTVLERGSSHILHQRDILLEEYGRYGVEPHVPHPKVVEKELAEYEEADFICIPSQYVERTFLEQGVPAEKLINVSYGVELTDFYPIPKQDSIFRLIHCGTLSIRKGIHYILQAFSELSLRHAELWLIGSMTEEIRPFFSRFSSPAICHLGPFPEFELHKYYSQGSVFCLSSIEEGFAMVQPQAMACGLPVICTSNTGGEDVVRDGRDGFIIPIRDVEALKEKILFFYENQDACVRMGHSAKERVRSGFTWADYGTRVLAEYEEVLRDG